MPMFDSLPTSEWFTDTLYKLVKACADFFTFLNTSLEDIYYFLPDFGDGWIAELVEKWVDYLAGGILLTFFPDTTFLDLILGAFVLIAVYNLSIWLLNLVT